MLLSARRANDGVSAAFQWFPTPFLKGGRDAANSIEAAIKTWKKEHGVHGRGDPSFSLICVVHMIPSPGNEILLLLTDMKHFTMLQVLQLYEKHADNGSLVRPVDGRPRLLLVPVHTPFSKAQPPGCHGGRRRSRADAL